MQNMRRIYDRSQNFDSQAQRDCYGLSKLNKRIKHSLLVHVLLLAPVTK